MNRFTAAGVLGTVFLVSPVSHAQGYVGAVAALSSVGMDCSDTLSCDKKGHGFKMYGGTKLSPANQINLGGFGKIDAVEVGVLTFGKFSSSVPVSYPVYDPDTGGSTTQNRVSSSSYTSNALTVAAVANFPILSDLAFSLKLGAAYESSTIRNYVDGAGNGSDTSTKLKPYIGLGLSYAVLNSVKIVSSYDRIAFDVAGQKSNASMFGLGAEIGF